MQPLRCPGPAPPFVRFRPISSISYNCSDYSTPPIRSLGPYYFVVVAAAGPAVPPLPWLLHVPFTWQRWSVEMGR